MIVLGRLLPDGNCIVSLSFRQRVFIVQIRSFSSVCRQLFKQQGLDLCQPGLDPFVGEHALRALVDD